MAEHGRLSDDDLDTILDSNRADPAATSSPDTIDHGADPLRLTTLVTRHPVIAAVAALAVVALASVAVSALLTAGTGQPAPMPTAAEPASVTANLLSSGDHGEVTSEGSSTMLRFKLRLTGPDAATSAPVGIVWPGGTPQGQVRPQSGSVFEVTDDVDCTQSRRYQAAPQVAVRHIDPSGPVTETVVPFANSQFWTSGDVGGVCGTALVSQLHVTGFRADPDRSDQVLLDFRNDADLPLGLVRSWRIPRTLRLVGRDPVVVPAGEALTVPVRVSAAAKCSRQFMPPDHTPSIVSPDGTRLRLVLLAELVGDENIAGIVGLPLDRAQRALLTAAWKSHCQTPTD